MRARIVSTGWAGVREPVVASFATSPLSSYVSCCSDD